MKKLNAQAELLSRPDGPPRASPADCDFLIDHKQNDTATGAELHALHLRSVIFFLFIHRLQAQADPGPGRTHTATEARATVIFVDISENPIYKKNGPL